MRSSHIKKRIGYAVLVAVIAYMVIVRTLAASYSILVADDFATANTMGLYQANIFEYIGKCFSYTGNMYRTWQGTYFAAFVQSLFSPPNYFGFRQLRIIMALNTLLFLFAIAFLIRAVCRKMGKEYLWMQLAIIAFAIFIFSDMDAFAELFFWFTGASAYTVPVSVLLLGLAFLVKTIDTPSIKHMICAALFGAMGMGGSLAVTAAGCCAGLLVCLFVFLEEKRFPVRQGIVFGVWLLCAIINAAAPGNFVRHGDSEVRLMETIDYSFEVVGIVWQELFNNTNIVCLLLLLVLFSFLSGKKTDGVRMSRVITSLLALLIPFVIAFPVALGYSNAFFPNRCSFVIIAALILIHGNLALVAGEVLRQLTEDTHTTLLCSFLAILAAMSVMLDGYGISRSTLRGMTILLRNGTYRTHYVECKQWLESLEAYEDGADVLVTQEEYPDEIAYTFNFMLYEDPGHWVNYSVAKWYGLNSIALLPGG